MTAILPLRERAGRWDDWLLHRLDTVVPLVMERAGIDCWVLVAREYNEDPVVRTMLPSTWLGARRRTILVFTEFGRDRAAIARYAVGDAFPAAWDPEEQPDQWRRLAAYLADRDPQRIGIDVSPTLGLADGLSASEHQALLAALGPDLGPRTTPADDLAIGWLETRSDLESAAYPEVCRIAHGLLRRAFTPTAVEPGTTSTDDLEWWLRQEVLDAGLSTWFQPSVSVQRREPSGFSYSTHPEAQVILAGDLIHIDFGIEYLGLHTDQQQHAYVLAGKETKAPAGLRAGMAAGNRAQEILMAEFRAGRTGNDVLASTRAACAGEGLDATIYTHAIGFHGHAAGPTIGLWDAQDGVPGAGDYPLQPNTAYSIELSVRVQVPEWDGIDVRIMLEEDAFFDGDKVTWLDGRQTDLWLM